MITKKDSNVKKVPPRQVPHRDDYYMGLAFWVASKSKDPNTQVGAIIISHDNIPLASGYNGPPRSIIDNSVDWSRPAKYDWVIHAESNAIKHVQSKDCLKQATVYVTALPCKACMLEMVAVGIKRVVYFSAKKLDEKSSLSDTTGRDKTFEIARSAAVTLDEFRGNLNWMRDHINWMESIGIFD